MSGLAMNAAAVATTVLRTAAKQIEESAVALDTLLQPGLGVLNGIGVLYSYEKGCFFLRRRDGLPFPFIEKSSGQQQLTSCFRSTMSHGGTQDSPVDITLPKEAVDFINSILFPSQGLVLELRSMGGGYVVDSSGAQIGNGGFCRLSYPAHLQHCLNSKT